MVMPLTSTLLESMVEHCIDGRRVIFVSVSVIGRHLLGILVTKPEVVVLIVVRDLGTAPGREAHFAELRRAPARRDSLEPLSMLLRKGPSTLTAVSVVLFRLRLD